MGMPKNFRVGRGDPVPKFWYGSVDKYQGLRFKARRRVSTVRRGGGRLIGNRCDGFGYNHCEDDRRPVMPKGVEIEEGVEEYEVERAECAVQSLRDFEDRQIVEEFEVYEREWHSGPEVIYGRYSGRAEFSAGPDDLDESLRGSVWNGDDECVSVLNGMNAFDQQIGALIARGLTVRNGHVCRQGDDSGWPGHNCREDLREAAATKKVPRPYDLEDVLFNDPLGGLMGERPGWHDPRGFRVEAE